MPNRISTHGAAKNTPNNNLSAKSENNTELGIDLVS